MSIPRTRVVSVVLFVAVALAAAGCSAVGSDGRLAAVEGRLANLEGRMVAIDSAGLPLEQGAGQAATTPKDDLGIALDPEVIEDAIVADGKVAVEVIELDLDPVIDLITARIRPIEGTEDDVAWESAKALAPLFTDLGEYAPALDLRVGDTRCICSAQLMKRIAAGSAARGDWTPACSS